MNFRPSLLLLALLASGCASVPDAPTVTIRSEPVAVPSAVSDDKKPEKDDAMKPPAGQIAGEGAGSQKAADKKSPSSTRLFPGNDQFFKRDIGPQADPVLATGDKVALNFENATVGNLARLGIQSGVAGKYHATLLARSVMLAKHGRIGGNRSKCADHAAFIKRTV